MNIRNRSIPLLGCLLAAVGLAIAAAVAVPAQAAMPTIAGISIADRLDMLGLVGLGGLIANRANLQIVYQGFNAAFNQGLGEATPQHPVIAMAVPSTTSENKYAWLGKIPGMREWIGPRQHQNLLQHDYSLKNKDYESTLDVDSNDIDDDQYGVYAPLFTEYGRSVAAHPDELVWALLKAGFGSTMGYAYDGQNFFDTDHPVLDAAGAEYSVANTDGGSGAPWFLMDSRGMMKPIILQNRKIGGLVRKDKEDDDNVFEHRTFVYGVHHRKNVGFGLWQKIWGSKQTLDKAAFKNAFAGLEGMKGDYGRPLGLMPDTLVVPPTLREVGLEILNAERDTAGATNVWRSTAKLVVVPWLA